MEDGLVSILKSYKTHHEDLSDILNKIQIDGNGQPDHAPFQNNINECNDIIFYLKKIILLYEAANENVQFYADNRDTLNEVFEKETKKIVEGFKPIWEFKYYYDDRDEYIDFLRHDTYDINEVKSVMKSRKAYDNCIKAVATVDTGIPRRLHNLHVPYAKIKEFKHEPITILPEKGEKYLKKPEQIKPDNDQRSKFVEK
jgi:hypothetical protein